MTRLETIILDRTGKGDAPDAALVAKELASLGLSDLELLPDGTANPTTVREVALGGIEATALGIVYELFRTRKRAPGEAIVGAVLEDHVNRTGRIVAHAIRVFGDDAKAVEWLRNPNPGLGSRRPVDLLKSDAGAYAVTESLHRIEHGIYA
jgi:putative toxin-antitoxin system antitoxin component (TIGR02293 family)